MGAANKFTRTKIEKPQGVLTTETPEKATKQMPLSLKKRNYETLRDNLANQSQAKVKVGPRAKKDGSYLNQLGFKIGQA